MMDRRESAQFYNSLKRPVLVLSSRAGRGNVSIAEAILEYFEPGDGVYHKSIEDFLPAAVVNEDLVRYKLISNHAPWVLSAIYTIPIFYYRKLLREKMRVTHLDAFKAFLQAKGIVTVVCVIHRQAFWTTVLKRNERLDLAIYGVLTEFGNNLGWKYLFWDEMNGFVAPLSAAELAMGVPDRLPFRQLPLPARASFHALSNAAATRREALLMGGYFGQGKLMHTLRTLCWHFPEIHLHVVCGDNARLESKIRRQFEHAGKVTVYGLIASIEGILARCGSVITKPGMATLLEAHASQRKIFLFKGMPVAEANNARYAIRHFDAEWFSPASFARWLASPAG
jgi:hypothetical protein